MAGRVEPTNTFDKAARYTAQKMRGPLSPSMGSGGSTTSSSPALPSSTTTAGTSGGVVYTIHPMIWGLDEWGDPGAVWTKSD